LSSQLAATESDSLDGAVYLAETSLRIRNTLSAIDASLEVLDETLAPLSIMLERINAGEGTLGRLAVDESLYVNADSTLAAAHRLLVGFEQNPKRYLEDLKLFSLF
jgi:phospholipid/cholesterol/gamma-HCH transport system substrate-binding protein